MKCASCKSEFYFCEQLGPSASICPVCGGQGKDVGAIYHIFGTHDPENGKYAQRQLSYRDFHALIASTSPYLAEGRKMVENILDCTIEQNDKGEPLLHHKDGRYIPITAALLKIVASTKTRFKLDRHIQNLRSKRHNGDKKLFSFETFHDFLAKNDHDRIIETHLKSFLRKSLDCNLTRKDGDLSLKDSAGNNIPLQDAYKKIIDTPDLNDDMSWLMDPRYISVYLTGSP